MISVNLNLDCADVSELIDAIDKLEARGIKATVQVSKPIDEPDKNEKGPNETRYNEVTGKRLRPSYAEQARINKGAATREDIASERLGTDSIGVTADLPKDDGRDVFGGDD